MFGFVTLAADGCFGKADVGLLAVDDPTAPAGFGLDAAEILTLPPASFAELAALYGSTYGVFGVDAGFAALGAGAGRPLTFDDADGSAFLVYPFVDLTYF